MLLTALRGACLLIFLYTSFSFSWQALTAFIAVLLSLALPDRFSESSQRSESDYIREMLDKNKNPLKGKPRTTEDDLDDDMIHRIEHQICQFVTYDAENAKSVHQFGLIMNNTQCKFARTAKIWGSPEWKSELSLEENILRTIPTFYKFVSLCEFLGMDGFVYELPGQLFGQSLTSFSSAVRRVLQVISDNDPAGFHCMDKSYLAKRGWCFEFSKVTIFITTFAPFYGAEHSRYAFESEHAYILFQPEISFAQHDLPPETPHTNWERPKTVRDHIRVAFKKAGRPYKIPETIFSPMVHDIVKPCNEFEDDVVEWWSRTVSQTDSNSQDECTEEEE